MSKKLTNREKNSRKIKMAHREFTYYGEYTGSTEVIENAKYVTKHTYRKILALESGLGEQTVFHATVSYCETELNKEGAVMIEKRIEKIKLHPHLIFA